MRGVFLIRGVGEGPVGGRGLINRALSHWASRSGAQSGMEEGNPTVVPTSSVITVPISHILQFPITHQQDEHVRTEFSHSTNCFSISAASERLQ